MEIENDVFVSRTILFITLCLFKSRQVKWKSMNDCGFFFGGIMFDFMVFYACM